MMKRDSILWRLAAALLTLAMMFSLVGCSGEAVAETSETPETSGEPFPSEVIQQPMLDVTSSNIPEDDVESLGDMLVGFMTAYLNNVDATPEAEYATPDIHPPFGADKSELMDNCTDAANALYQLCYAQPEVLTATMSAFPELTGFTGTAAEHCTAIEAALESADGGKVQKALLEKLKTALEADTTQMVFGYWTGQTVMTYMVKRDETAEATPENMTIVWEYVELEDEPIFGIAIPRRDGGKDFGYFAMQYGFQRIIPVIDWLSLVNAQ